MPRTTLLLLLAGALSAAGDVVTSLPVRYLRFSRSGTNYIGMQEVEIFNTTGDNVAAGCTVTASNGLHKGSLSMIVNGAWNYSNGNEDVLVGIMANPWIELDLGAPRTTLTTLNLYIDSEGSWGNSDWWPGNNIFFMDAYRNGVANVDLPASWSGGDGAGMPYVVDIAALFLPYITPTTTPTPTNSPTYTPTNTPNPSCLPSSFRLLPGSDLVGDVLSTSLTSAPTEHMCALTCCSTSGCEGYTWSTFLVSNANPCFLLTNVTAYTTNKLLTSGVQWSAQPLGESPL